MRNLSHLPRRYNISATVFADCIAATLHNQVTDEQIKLLTPILMNDFSYSLISAIPDDYAVERPETADGVAVLPVALAPLASSTFWLRSG